MLYLFLLLVVRAVWRDLQLPGRAHAPRPSGNRQRRRESRLRPQGQPNIQVVQAADAGLNPGEVIALSGVTTIGREADNDLVVDEDTVSSYHARLLARDGAWWIEDLKSTNGTLVNDAKVAEPRALRSGDVIQMGRVQLRFSG